MARASGSATGICYGLALPMPHLGVIMAWVVLCRPGEPLSLGKGLLGGALLLAVMVGGVLLVPLLTHYALAAVLLVALLLYLLMQQAMAGKGRRHAAHHGHHGDPGGRSHRAVPCHRPAQMMGPGILIRTPGQPPGPRAFSPSAGGRAAGAARAIAPEHPGRAGASAVAMVLLVGYGPAIRRLLHSGGDEDGDLAQQSTSPQRQTGGPGAGARDSGWAALLAFALLARLAQPLASLLMLVLMLAPDDPLAGAAPGAAGGGAFPAILLEQRLDHGAHPVWPGHRGQRHRQGCVSWRPPCAAASIWWWPAMAGSVSCCSNSGGQSAAHWQKPLGD